MMVVVVICHLLSRFVTQHFAQRNVFICYVQLSQLTSVLPLKAINRFVIAMATHIIFTVR